MNTRLCGSVVKKIHPPIQLLGAPSTPHTRRTRSAFSSLSFSSAGSFQTDLLPFSCRQPPAGSIPPLFPQFFSHRVPSQQVLRKPSYILSGQRAAFFPNQSTAWSWGNLTPVSCALDQACGPKTQVSPWEERQVVALRGPTGRMQAHPLPLQCRLRFLLPVLLNTLASGNSNMSRPISQDFPGGQW